MYYVDTETCGLHGPIVLIQYAETQSSTVIQHNVWREPIIESLEIIERIVENGICGFNLTFDWFHLCQLYNVLSLLSDKVGANAYPEDHIDLYAELEPQGRDGLCLKPKTALDLMLYARKGPYQSTMDRKDIKIKRVPRVMAERLINELTKRIVLNDIYFSRKSDKSKRWEIQDIKDDKQFVNIILRFRPSAALKIIVQDALKKNRDDVLQFHEISVPKRYNPLEAGWAPFAKAISTKEQSWHGTIKTGKKTKTGVAWPGVIKRHIDHWAFDSIAKKYADDDVVYLQELHKFFSNPEPGDVDSILACMVGAVRWRGYAIDIDSLQNYRKECLIESKAAPTYSKHVFRYLADVMNDSEREFIKESTKRVILETISKWEEDCSLCKGVGCSDCKEGGVPHKAAVRAISCLNARQAQTKISNIDKLLQAGRFHVSLKVIGTLSGRMSGSDGLNATGIQHEKRIRRIFNLALPGMQLNGGDFDAYEVGIADACFDDPILRKELLTCFSCGKARTVDQYDDDYCPHCHKTQAKCKKCGTSGLVADVCCTECTIEPTMRKIHGLFGMTLKPGTTYDDVLATRGSKEDLYDMGKRGVFSQFYGGNYNTLMNRLGIDEERARIAEQTFANTYPGVAKNRQTIFDNFCALRQPDGIGSAVYWNEPAEYIESLNGHRRYFTLENAIMKALFALANKPPKEWKELKIDCVRRDRVQLVGGAVQSAIFAAAFNIQSQNMRAAANHRIQSTGAIETKNLQAELWSEQPIGIKPWVVQPFNIHDEILAPSVPEVADRLVAIVDSFIKKTRSLIPLIKMKFLTTMETWADK